MKNGKKMKKKKLNTKMKYILVFVLGLISDIYIKI